MTREARFSPLSRRKQMEEMLRDVQNNRFNRSQVEFRHGVRMTNRKTEFSVFIRKYPDYPDIFSSLNTRKKYKTEK